MAGLGNAVAVEALGRFGAVGSWSDMALLLGLSTTRVAVAFLLVPLFTADLIPALVRNSLFAALALLGLALQPSPPNLNALAGWQWAALFGKEAFVGGVIGFCFGGMLWAFEAAGQIVDTKVGSSLAQVLDPLSGHQTSLTGAFLARLAGWVFMAGGGLMLMVGVLMESYALWPVATTWPGLVAGGGRLFEVEFGRILRLALMVAAPALVVLYMVDGVLGLVNRFAQQLNVFSLSMSIKAVAANAVLWLQVAMLAQVLSEDLLARPAYVLDVLRNLLTP
jgi:type III secretion protein T